MKRSRSLILALATLVGILATEQAFAFFGFFDDDDDRYWRRHWRHGGPYGWGGPHGWGGPYGHRPYGWGNPYGWGYASPYGWGYPGYNNPSGNDEPPPPPPLPE